MAAAVLYMSMSLDGFIAGPNDEPGNPGGDGFGRLHEWFYRNDEFIRPPDASVARFPLVTYVTDGIVSAMAQARGCDCSTCCRRVWSWRSCG